MMTFSKCFQRISKTHSARDQNFQELTILAAELLSPASLLKPPFKFCLPPPPPKKKGKQQQKTLNYIMSLDLILPPLHVLSPALTSNVFNCSTTQDTTSSSWFYLRQWTCSESVHSYLPKTGPPAEF